MIRAQLFAGKERVMRTSYRSMITAGVALLLGSWSLQSSWVQGASFPASPAGPAWAKTFSARAGAGLPSLDAAPPVGPACGVAATQSFNAPALDVGIPDPPGAPATSTIVVAGTTNPVIWDVDVRVELAHPVTNQLRVVLYPPGGAPILLADRDGGPFYNTL
ncbi:MAG: hypothetical protein IT186_05990, partial [Acidobacteria bacterium]|nr:hypothetical protein [Acidobacteriota bacterium]